MPVPTPVVVAETQNVVTETLEEPCPEEEEVLPVAEPLPVVQELQVVEVPVEPKKDTWWETYKKNKSVKPAEVQCPCPDPNEPCPQCVDK